MAGAGNAINQTSTGICGFTGTSFTGTAVTNHAVQVGSSNSYALTQLTVGTNGQVLVGATTADPAFATLTSSDSSITFTTGANSLSLQVTSGTTVGKTITGDSGGALSPTSGNWNILGSGSTTTVGSGSTLTVQLTGLTNHAVLVGAGTTTITKVSPSATSGVPLISQGASADPTFGTAVVAGGGTGNTTQTAYSLVAGGTTTTGAFQAVGPNSSSNAILMATGTSSLPAFTTSGTPYVTGISFNSGTDTLSVYSNGTWTPTITGSTGNPTPTYTAQTGTYRKIGDMVYISCFITVSALTGGTGNFEISGLPFTSVNVTTEQAWFAGLFVNTTTFRMMVKVQPNATKTTIYVGDGGAGSFQLPQTATTQISFAGFYQST